MALRLGAEALVECGGRSDATERLGTIDSDDINTMKGDRIA